VKQAELFEAHMEPIEPTEQACQIARVRSRIGEVVLTFVRGKGVGATFHAEELSLHVAARLVCAPGSADRILRQLRREGALSYAVENRAQSLYRVLAVGGSDGSL
jgi:hypothetical protein